MVAANISRFNKKKVTPRIYRKASIAEVTCQFMVYANKHFPKCLASNLF